MYGSFPGNAVVVNLLMRWPLLVPVAAIIAAPVVLPPPVVETKCIVHFANDKYDVTPTELASLSKCMKDVDVKKVSAISVSGHTDSKWTSSYNSKLSQRRSLSVKEVLVKMGVDGQKISVSSHGLDQPVADNNTLEGRALNRRVEVTIR